jgi:very-short-patch-repair endonuclease
MSHQRVTPFLRTAARTMRSRPIDVERDLWWRLRRHKLDRLKFRRQHPVGRYIADFVCLEAKLIVELDGKQHQGSLSDVARTEDLVSMGFRVIRFDNESVRSDIGRVCEAIRAAVKVASRHSSSDPAQSAAPPSPTRGEG